MANFGTKSKYDLKTKDAADLAWFEIEEQIKGLDEQMYKAISKQDD